MDLLKKELIQERAESLFPVIRDHLNRHYEIDPSVGNTFKFLYLIAYGPRRYLTEFRAGTLSIELEDVRDTYMDWSDYVPGKYGLLDEEVDIIKRHNLEVEKYLNSQGISHPRSAQPSYAPYCLS